VEYNSLGFFRLNYKNLGFSGNLLVEVVVVVGQNMSVEMVDIHTLLLHHFLGIQEQEVQEQMVEDVHMDLDVDLL
jgi:hypothetical protein